MDNSNYILQKIRKISTKKNFFGISKKELLKQLNNINSNEIEELSKKDEIIIFKNLYFPRDWNPVFTQTEIEVINFIKPCFVNVSKIEISKILGNFKFFNDKALILLLNKLEFNKIIIKLDEKVYINKEDFENYRELAEKLSEFTLKAFKDKASLRRESALKLLNKFDELGITIFDGNKRKIKGAEL